jgi:hypothetical protein
MVFKTSNVDSLTNALKLQLLHLLGKIIFSFTFFEVNYLFRDTFFLIFFSLFDHNEVRPEATESSYAPRLDAFLTILDQDSFIVVDCDL